MEQLLDNLSYMDELVPLNEEENALIRKAVEIINSTIEIPAPDAPTVRTDVP